MKFWLQHPKISSKCFVKFMLLSNVIPKNLCEDSTKEGHRTGSALIADRDLENVMTFVFSGFSFILHLAHHLASLSRSLCRYSAALSTLGACFHNPFYLSLVYMRPQCMIFNLNLMPPSQSKHSLYGMRWVFLT